MSSNPWMNAWIMKNREGEGSSVGGNSERHLGKRPQWDLCVDEISQVRGPKKTKMESPPAPKAYLFQPGEKWTSVDNFPVEVFDGFKLGKHAQFDDGLTRGEITSRCLNGMGQVLSDFVRIMDGFGSGGQVEVDNLRTALDQSEKEKAVLRDQLSLANNMYYETENVMRLQLEHSEKEKADLRDKLDLVFKLYETCRVQAEEERALLKAELEKLKAQADKQVKIKLDMAKDDATNSSKEDIPA
ncbi:hypothetical protein AG4045_016137 [Apium graveolens]|uniref:Uncharacterized protein n=1 Tax=Apium graveolens TaxID=4045 RepID=A0A6L5BAY0_APIGR|nr:hypothetical protein AG4045_016137 [Apium graveolens]